MQAVRRIPGERPGKGLGLGAEGLGFWFGPGRRLPIAQQVGAEGRGELLRHGRELRWARAPSMQVDHTQLCRLGCLDRPRDATLGTRLQRRLVLVACAQPRFDVRHGARQVGREQLQLAERPQGSVDFISEVGCQRHKHRRQEIAWRRRAVSDDTTRSEKCEDERR
eukprot:scaffold18040_cov63-Phaeocystis_antarctica.AAC.2